MVVITQNDIFRLNVNPLRCIEWVKQSFQMRSQADMPPKICQHMAGDVLVNTLPCLLPSINRYAVKVVTRHPGQSPTLKSKILLVDMTNGDTLACLDGNWITAWRTGAVAALAGKVFIGNFKNAAIGFVGLGTMAHSTFECLQSLFTVPHDIWLLRYKDQAEKFEEKYSKLPNIKFHLTDSREELIKNTSALYSCVTVMNEQFLPAELYPAGYTLIPVHMRGFQDCDTCFDRIFGDDRGYLSHFQHFNEFKYFGEFSKVLLGIDAGRRNLHERIICYNIGLALHDLFFASRIYDEFQSNSRLN